MTIMPIYKICPKCYRRYQWNPDTGMISCPYCSRKEISDGGIFGGILKKFAKNEKK